MERKSVTINDIAKIFLVYFCIIDSFIHVMVFWHAFLFDPADASPVKHLRCEGPNKRDAELILSWAEPNGSRSSFRVTVTKDNEIIYLSHTMLLSYDITSNLSHHTDYKLTVETQSCGLPSTPVICHRRTGITSRTLCFVNIRIT